MRPSGLEDSLSDIHRQEGASFVLERFIVLQGDRLMAETAVAVRSRQKAILLS